MNIQLINGIKNRLISQLQHLTNVVRISFFASLFLVSCRSRKIEKEVWELPCNYSGFAIVYFDGDSNSEGSGGRNYRINRNGVAYINGLANDGFALRLKDVVLVVENCGGKIDTLPYYENDELDTVTVRKYATHLVVGKKGGKYFRSINVVRNR